MEEDKMIQTSLRLTEDTLAKLDKIIKQKRWSSRNKAIGFLIEDAYGGIEIDDMKVEG